MMVSPPSHLSAEYSMADDALRHSNNKRRHRRGGATHEDDSGSLTYSATSSINSGASSAAGESTDSSFADIMRVLALQEDGPELEALMKKEGYDPKMIARARAKNGDATSVASSLNYSTDGESALNGDDVLQTITGGQPSDSYGPDGGGIGLVRETQQSGPMTQNIVFAPADPVDRHHRKSSKGSRSSRLRSKTSPNVPGSPKGEQHRPSSNAKGTPPPAPRRVQEVNDPRCDEDSLWYAKWWMCGFTDALRELVPKR